VIITSEIKPFAVSFGFNETDLQHNRQGILSAKQRETYAEKYKRGNSRPYLIAFIVVFFGGIFLMANTTTQALQIPIITIMVILGSILGIIAWETDRRNQRLDADILKGAVSVVCGQALTEEGFITMARGNLPVFKLHIEDQMTFYVSEEQLPLFKDGETYRIYYTPNNQQIMSIEPDERC